MEEATGDEVVLGGPVETVERIALDRLLSWLAMSSGFTEEDAELEALLINELLCLNSSWTVCKAFDRFSNAFGNLSELTSSLKAA